MPSPPAKLRSPAIKALAVARRRYVDVEPVAYVAMTARRAQRASGSVRIDGDRHSARQLPRAWRRRLPNSELQAGNLLASCATVTVFLTQPGSHSRERHIDLPSLVPKRRNKIRQITKHASACSMQGPRLNPRETNIISSDRESSYHISSYLMSSVKHTVAVSRNFERNRGRADRCTIVAGRGQRCRNKVRQRLSIVGVGHRAISRVQQGRCSFVPVAGHVFDNDPGFQVYRVIGVAMVPS
jgi:hypothetical protein